MTDNNEALHQERQNQIAATAAVFAELEALIAESDECEMPEAAAQTAPVAVESVAVVGALSELDSLLTEHIADVDAPLERSVEPPAMPSVIMMTASVSPERAPETSLSLEEEIAGLEVELLAELKDLLCTNVAGIEAPLEPPVAQGASEVAERSEPGAMVVADQPAVPWLALDDVLTGADADLLKAVVAEVGNSRDATGTPMTAAMRRVIAEGLEAIEGDRIERRRARLRPVWRQEYAERKLRTRGQGVRDYDRAARDRRFEEGLSPEERRAEVKKASYERCSDRKRINAKPSQMTDEDRAAHENLKREEKNAKRKAKRAAAKVKAPL